MINIGQSIREELERQERTVSWLARKLNCNRSLVYRILGKNSIDTGMLIRISRILKHDFFKEFVEDYEAEG
ncbi:XRE family transcriptional regulator [Palleniella muris]|uniref:XRE family transcriptional regulator n=1 Tax=Palleniella muris TaxID=3038145 RepID=A0AC61QQN3_9BACT|nr:XRE family transcriptional regulator [Palleniella muris]TGX82471.1 XRE family transcriptional regulator [Palleniella muris]